MANPERGEVDLVVIRRIVNGKPEPEEVEKTYTLRMRANAICELQERTKKSYGELLGDLGRVDYVSMRHLLFTFLQPYHAKEFKTQESVGDLIDDAHGHNGIISTLTELFRRNKPPQKAGRDANGPNPPTAQADGTGDNSTPTVAASV